MRGHHKFPPPPVPGACAWTLLCGKGTQAHPEEQQMQQGSQRAHRARQTQALSNSSPTAGALTLEAHSAMHTQQPRVTASHAFVQSHTRACEIPAPRSCQAGRGSASPCTTSRGQGGAPYRKQEVSSVVHQPCEEGEGAACCEAAMGSEARPAGLKPAGGQPTRASLQVQGRSAGTGAEHQTGRAASDRGCRDDGRGSWRRDGARELQSRSGGLVAGKLGGECRLGCHTMSW